MSFHWSLYYILFLFFLPSHLSPSQSLKNASHFSHLSSLKIKTCNVLKFPQPWRHHITECNLFFISPKFWCGIHGSWLLTFTGLVCVCELWLWKAQWFLLMCASHFPTLFISSSFGTPRRLQEYTLKQEVMSVVSLTRMQRGTVYEYNSLFTFFL